jgi:F-type H+-transporting ATPase subunit delta
MPKTIVQVKRQSKLLFRWCLVDGRLDEHRAREVVKYVLESRRRGYLAVLGEFTRLLKLEDARHTAKVESAVPLTADLQARLQTSLESAYGEGMNTEFLENTDLIGGMRIRVANDVYDGSVRFRLTALAASFGIRNE